MRVNELQLQLVKHPASRTPLYPHQAAIWEEWERQATMLLPAKTGTGKTRAAMRGYWVWLSTPQLLMAMFFISLALSLESESLTVHRPSSESLSDYLNVLRKQTERFRCLNS
jgi:hypothetical protein